MGGRDLTCLIFNCYLRSRAIHAIVNVNKHLTDNQKNIDFSVSIIAWVFFITYSVRHAPSHSVF